MTPASTYAAEQIAKFLLEQRTSSRKPPDTSGIFDPSFVEAYAARQCSVRQLAMTSRRA